MDNGDFSCCEIVSVKKRSLHSPLVHAAPKHDSNQFLSGVGVSKCEGYRARGLRIVARLRQVDRWLNLRTLLRC